MSDKVKELFLYEYGAKSIENEEQLALAMDALFWYRNDLQLELAAMFKIAAPPSLDTCSMQTQNVGYKIHDNYFKGMQFGHDVLN